MNILKYWDFINIYPREKPQKLYVNDPLSFLFQAIFFCDYVRSCFFKQAVVKRAYQTVYFKKKRRKKSATPGLPKWSPTLVLPRPDDV